MTPMVHFKF